MPKYELVATMQTTFYCTVEADNYEQACEVGLNNLDLYDNNLGWEENEFSTDFEFSDAFEFSDVFKIEG